MKNKKILLLALTLLLAIIVLLIALIPSRREYNWDIYAAPSEAGSEPYDIDILDSLLTRSLPNGYSVRMLEEFDPQKDQRLYINRFDFTLLNAIAKASTDTSILVVKQYPWNTNNDRELMPLLQLLHFAQKGGTALLVTPSYDNNIPFLMEDLNLDKHLRPVYNEYNFTSKDNGDPYTPKWYPGGYVPSTLLTPGHDPVTIDDRLCINYFNMYYTRTKGYHYNCQNIVSHKNGVTEVIISPMLIDQSQKTVAYALDFYFPETGGHLYVSLLGLPFTNMGLTAPNSHLVVSELMSNIDHKPVVRLQYPKISYSTVDLPESSQSVVLSRIYGNDALRFAWILSLTFILLVLSCGLMRRHPAVKGIEAEDIDRSDAMAVREYKFRKSPLLHFLYQCSWLYNGAKDYRELLDINYRQLARIVSRYVDIELTTASDDDLKRAAEIFAARLGSDKTSVFADLKWMQSFGVNPAAPVSPKQYKYSQKVLENFL